MNENIINMSLEEFYKVGNIIEVNDISFIHQPKDDVLSLERNTEWFYDKYLKFFKKQATVIRERYQKKIYRPTHIAGPYPTIWFVDVEIDNEEYCVCAEYYTLCYNKVIKICDEPI